MPTPVKWSSSDFTLDNGVSEGERLAWVTATPEGRFVVNYTEQFAVDNEDVDFQRYAADGTELDDNNVAGSAATDERLSSSAYLADGRHAVVWTERPDGGGGDLGDIYFKVFYADDSIDVGRTLVAGGAGEQEEAVVAASPDGGFAIVVNDRSVAGGQLIAKFYGVAGNLIDTATPANTTGGISDPLNSHRNMAITALSNGNYVVTWTQFNAVGTRGQIFSPAGDAVGDEFFVLASQNFPINDVTALADGRFVVFARQPGLATTNLLGRFFSSDGVAEASAFSVATNLRDSISGDEWVNSTALPDGRFVVVWVNNSADIEGRVMFANGATDGGTFIVNSDQTTDKRHPSVAALADGRFVVSWKDSIGGVDRITSTIFDPREVGLYGAASSFNDDWHGTNFTDTIFGGTGNDTINGAGAIDYLYGEAGIDTLNGDAAEDRLYGGNEGDTLNGGDSNDFLYGQIGDDTLNGDAGADSAYGGDGDDTLNGGTEIDILDGQDGADTLNGDDGDDLLRGRAGNDVLLGGDEADDARGGNDDDSINGQDGNDSFLAGEAGDDLVVGGPGNDRIDGGSENDNLVGEADSDNITGGSGDDFISGSAGDDGNGLGILQGQDGNDTVSGGSGIDRLEGGNNNDRLTGGLGNDVLAGGTGLDIFVFTDDTDGNDRIDDWVAASDQLEIDASAFGGGLAAGALAANRLVVGAAPVANQNFGQFLYNITTGQLAWDIDGTALGAAVNIARLLNSGVAAGTLAVADFDIVA